MIIPNAVRRINNKTSLAPEGKKGFNEEMKTGFALMKTAALLPNEAKSPTLISPVLIPSFAQRLHFASLALAEGDFIEKA